MKHTVSDAEGKVPDEFIGAFDQVAFDTEGVPLIQTIAGMVLFEPKAVENGVIVYSANIGVDGESLSLEVSNIAKYLIKCGYDLQVVSAHYIDPQGQISYGDEARKVKRHIDTTVILQSIQQMQKNLDHPGLVLPDSKIITR
ncbi:hypothetical protein P3446_12955 [Escherichia coli]|uniref:hypothetical protein n=1 Tax=Escherichia coli TaxID=562 RepID=UPI0023EB365A|nr:hypothetical protein [Escherichia coli]MDF4164658.1 hypothetical protein [Escherichia coli]